MIVIVCDPYPSTPCGGTWWEVAVPEASERTDGNVKRAAYAENKMHQRGD